MTWSLAATIIGVFNGIVTFIKSVFGKKTETAASSGPSVTEVNTASKQSAAVARDAQTQSEEQIHESQNATAADVAAVRAAPSLQAGGERVADAIRRANGDVRRK